jgi:ATP-dependent protease ClpP protease subunit
MKRKALYEIKAQAAGEAEVWLYGQIGLDFWGDGIDAKQFCQDLADLEASHISLRVNSPGGSVSHGHAIYNAILRHPAAVTSYIDGVALSISSCIALAAEEVVIAENALYMVHQPFGAYCGYFNAAELRKEADITDKFAETLVGVYAKRTGMSAEDIAALMDEESWYTGQEAVDAGFADRVSEDGNTADLAAAFDLERLGYKHLPDALRQTTAKAASKLEPPVPEPVEDASGDTDPTITAKAVDLLTRPRNGGL